MYLTIHFPDALTLFYLVGVVASVLGVALFVIRRPERAKRLAYDVGYAIALANVLPQSGSHRITLTFEREGQQPQSVRGVYVHFVRLANFGKEPIRSDDLASGDPLRIDVRRAKVLDIAIAGVTREVIGFEVGQPDRSGPKLVSALLTFAFLDEGDGALVRVTTDSNRAEISVNGTIVGMPHGIATTDALNRSRPLQILGVVLIAATYALTMVLAVLAFHAVTQSWQSLWLFPVPIVALLLPLVPILFVESTIWPSGPRWHARLMPPFWAQIPRELMMTSGFREAIVEPPRRSITRGRGATADNDPALDAAWRKVMGAMPASKRALFREATLSRQGVTISMSFPYEFHRHRAVEFQTEVEQQLREQLGEDTTVEIGLAQSRQRKDRTS